jgi:uncharacterized protein
MESDERASAEYASVTLLLDFYGELLSPGQSEALDLHYNNDLSLAEIAEETGVSRQAVHDAIRAGKAMLAKYEGKLGLAARFAGQQEMIRQALALVRSAAESLNPLEQMECMQRAGNCLERLLEQL